MDAPIRMYVRGTVEERLIAWSRTEGSHLIWTGNTYTNGYGKMRVDGVNQLIHRLAYELWVGPIPSGHEVDHLLDICGVRRCFHPQHLEAVLPAENLRRMKLPRDPVTGRYVKRHHLPGTIDL